MAADDQDDNPFAGRSPWPKMPQAPFRVGPLPKAGPAPPPRSITPLYVRPADDVTPSPPVAIKPDAAEGLTAAPPLPGSRQPGISSEPAVPDDFDAPPPPAGAVAGPAASFPGRRRSPARRRSAMPAVVAVVVAIVGFAGLAYLFISRPARQSPAAPVSAPAAAPAPAPPSLPSVTATAPIAPRLAAAQAPSGTRRTSRPAPAVGEERVQSLPSDAAVATEEALGAPVLALPPAPRQAEVPAYRPPPAPDPSAPVTTQRPY